MIAPKEQRPRLTESEHRLRRAASLASVIDLACHKLGIHPYKEAARIAKTIRELSGDLAGWKLMADYARIGKAPSPKTIEALATIYDTRALFVAGRRAPKAVR